jgi:hypothetical protein
MPHVSQSFNFQGVRLDLATQSLLLELVLPTNTLRGRKPGLHQHESARNAKESVTI